MEQFGERQEKQATRTKSSLERLTVGLKRKVLIGATAIASLGVLEKATSPTDYGSDMSFNQAFRDARESGANEFKWKDKKYNTQLVDKEFSDLYLESKKFLADYYNSEYFKNKYKAIATDSELQQIVSQRIKNLKVPTYFSITQLRGKKKEDPYFDPETGKLFIPRNSNNKEVTPIHELTHKSTRVRTGKDTEHSVDLESKALNSFSRNDTKKGYLGYGTTVDEALGWLKYLSDPSEIEARQNSTRFWLFKHFPGYRPDSPFTQAHAMFLKKNFSNLPHDIKQLMEIFPEGGEFAEIMNKF